MTQRKIKLNVDDMLRTKTILITGITGMVGSHMADYILENYPDFKIVGLKRWRSPMDNIEHIKDKLELYNGDLKDMASVIDLLRKVRPDVIYHFAAQSYVPVSFTMPVETLETNIIGTANLLESLRILSMNPFICICSSSEVYGQVLPNEVPIKETNPFRPASPYAVSKVGEDMIAWQYFTSYRMNIVRTRLFTHCGPRRGDVFAESSFAKQIAEIETGKKEPVIYVGNLDSVRTYLDVKDAVRAYWLTQQCPAGEVYNIGGNQTMKVGEMLDMMIGMSPMKDKIRIEVDTKRLRPSDVTLQVPSTERFEKVTGWRPMIPVSQTFSDLLNYWRGRA